MKNEKIKSLAYMALYVALYVVLKYVGDLIVFLKMPNGGSIELELIAVFIASYHMGWKKGACIGLLSWLMAIVLGFKMYFVNPAQIVLDYAGPLIVCGMASAFWPFEKVSKPVSVILGVLVGLCAFGGIAKSWNGTAAIIAAVIVGLITCAFTIWYVVTKRKFGIVISMLLKYVMTVLSGAYFWAEGTAAGSSAAWAYSITYNLWYNLVTMIVCLFIVPLLCERLQKAHIKFAIK